MLAITLDIKKELGDFFKFETIESTGTLITNALEMAIGIAALLLLLYLVMGGIQWLTSGGEKTGVAAAKAKITNAFLGLMVVLAAWAVFALTKYMFGVPGATPGGPAGPGPQPTTAPPPSGYVCPSGDPPKLLLYPINGRKMCVGWWECEDNFGKGWYCEVFKDFRGDASDGWCCPPKP